MSKAAADGLFAGIDYGSKLAGTTVIAACPGRALRFWACPAKTDADAFVAAWCREHRPVQVFLDAPLSLPGVYRGIAGCDDYFYRVGDRALSAMSPMFLGGLTARAMRLRAALEKTDIRLLETYPGHLAKALALKEHGYKGSKKKIPEVLHRLREVLPRPCAAREVLTWHHLDALLAWWSGYRFQRGSAEIFGRADEGQIIV